MTETRSIAILGLNGNVGRAAAIAFRDAGWRVIGFARSDRHRLSGITFRSGDAESVTDMKAAIADSQVVLHALNLPYADWYHGRAEAQTDRVLEAVAGGGRTLLFPANVYNYAATDAVMRPETPQRPETPRGAIRVRIEAAIARAATSGDMQALMLRAGDFFGAGTGNTWLDIGVLRELDKGRIASPGPLEMHHAWAYLPDLARAFVALAERRTELDPFENFHFAGHYVTNRQMLDALQAAWPAPLRETGFPWSMLGLLGLAMPMLREVVKMRYLWQHEMQLEDQRLAALLGPDFATPLDAAIAETLAARRPAMASAA